MKENDIVTLSNFKSVYKDKNLYCNVNGIVLKPLSYDRSLVLFLNDKIIGDYAVVEVDNSDIKKENVKLPLNFIKELKYSNKLSETNLSKKQKFKSLDINEYDLVELLVEKEEYSKYGVHIGYRGVVAIDYAVNGYILVDFSGVDKHGNFYGDCVSVKIDDVKILKQY